MDLIKTTVFRHRFSRNPDIIMFMNWQGINQMDLSAYLDDLKKLHKHESVTKKLKKKQNKIQGVYQCNFMPLCTTLILTNE